MIEFTITKAQAQDFAASCFAVIIGEIKDACTAEETEAPATENTDYKNAA